MALYIAPGLPVSVILESIVCEEDSATSSSELLSANDTTSHVLHRGLMKTETSVGGAVLHLFRQSVCPALSAVPLFLFHASQYSPPHTVHRQPALSLPLSL